MEFLKIWGGVILTITVVLSVILGIGWLYTNEYPGLAVIASVLVLSFTIALAIYNIDELI